MFKINYHLLVAVVFFKWRLKKGRRKWERKCQQTKHNGDERHQVNNIRSNHVAQGEAAAVGRVDLDRRRIGVRALRHWHGELPFA